MFRRRFFIVEECASDDVSVFKSNHVIVNTLSLSLSLSVTEHARVFSRFCALFPILIN